MHSDFLVNIFVLSLSFVGAKTRLFLGISLKKWTDILLHLERVNCVRKELCFVPTMCIS